MKRAQKTEQKRSKSPKPSIFQSLPASIMWPRLMVIFSAAVLAVIGLVMVYSASSISSYADTGNATGEAIKQVLFTLFGVALCVALVLFAKQDAIFGWGAYAFWGLCVLLMIATQLFGTAALGAKRWLLVGGVSIQISEFLKISLVIMAARIAQQYQAGQLDFRDAFIRVAVFIVLPLVFLFIAQSDMGTTAICVVGLIAVLWFSGIDRRIMVLFVILIILLGVVGIASQAYRSSRFVFLDPWSNAEDTGYQLIRGFKAFAAGGLFGEGIGNSYEKMLYLPMAETDFIFAILGEEMGLVGTLFVVALFMVMLRGGFGIASQIESKQGALCVAGLTSMIVFQAFLNIACVIGIAPTTGKPLPFISSGGSSLVSSFMLVGVVLAIAFDNSGEDEYRQRRESLRVVSAAPVSDRGSAAGGYRSGSTERMRDTFRAVGDTRSRTGGGAGHRGGTSGRVGASPASGRGRSSGSRYNSRR